MRLHSREEVTSSKKTTLDVLLLAVEPRKSLANTLRDHIEALRTKSRHRVFVLQNYLALSGSWGGRVSAVPRWFPLEGFAALVVHYSNYMASPGHLDQPSRERIKAFPGLKVAFIQDEYRTVNATVASLRELEFDLLFTCVPEPEVEKVYPADALPQLRKVSTLTGFVPEKLASLSVPSLRERRFDVGYRSRVVPFWLGELGAEKWQIVSRFLEHAKGSGLRLDISCDEADRLYGPQWIEFLLSCKTVLGVESGASVFDFTGEIQQEVDQYVASKPGATFQEVQARFLSVHEGRIRLHQISPRCFEAAALRTAMVLYEGQYSGILKPWRHYVPLRKDFGNIGEVLNAIRDTAGLQKIADSAYQEIALNPEYSYQAFVDRFDAVLEEEAVARAKIAAGGTYRVNSLRMLHRVRIARFRAIQLILKLGYQLGYLMYVVVVPATFRARLRPFMRRYIVKE